MVVVIGAGATGLGVAWDLALRGIPVTVLEQNEVGTGTSGRFHGLLHSGSRYVVTDPQAAIDCRQENAILRQIASAVIEPTGGYFVSIGDDTAAYEEQWLRGCAQAGIIVKPQDAPAIRREVPEITPDLVRGWWVPDGVIEGFALLQSLVRGITRHGGRLLTHTVPIAIRTFNGRVSGVKISGPGGTEEIQAEAVINASGPWAGEVSDSLWGDPIPMERSAGMMLIFAHRHGDRVINRLALPGDGDILVPHQSVSIFGTTDVPQERVEDPLPLRSDAYRLLMRGLIMFPSMDKWRIIRAFTGVRPLYDPHRFSEDPRTISRDFTLIRHSDRHGPEGIFSVVGGKWTTFRLMAERVVDTALKYLAHDAPCRTREISITEEPKRVAGYPVPAGPVIACECESVTIETIASHNKESLDVIRTKTWAGMGPCQGTFCGHRMAAIRRLAAGNAVADTELQDFREERAHGIKPVMWGDNAREWMLQRAMRLQTLGEAER